MKIKNSMILSSMFGIALLVPIQTYAAPGDQGEVSGNYPNTPVTVEILQKPIGMTSVKAPTFATYELTGKSQVLQATGDLTVEIEDIRPEGSSPWEVQYGISVFKNDIDGKELSNDVIVKVGTGSLSINGTPADSSVYKSQSLELSQEKQGSLVQVTESTTGKFKYTVPKENISIQVSKNATAGNYQAVQSVNLINIPVVN